MCLLINTSHTWTHAYTWIGCVPWTWNPLIYNFVQSSFSYYDNFLGTLVRLLMSVLWFKLLSCICISLRRHITLLYKSLCWNSSSLLYFYIISMFTIVSLCWLFVHRCVPSLLHLSYTPKTSPIYNTSTPIKLAHSIQGGHQQFGHTSQTSHLKLWTHMLPTHKAIGFKYKYYN